MYTCCRGLLLLHFIEHHERLPLTDQQSVTHSADSALHMTNEHDICHDAGIVMVLTIFMAAASGLGAVPYFFVRSFSKEYSALASAVACGVMLAASFDLVHEGQPYGANLVILGVLSGTPLCKADYNRTTQCCPEGFSGCEGMSNSCSTAFTRFKCFNTPTAG